MTGQPIKYKTNPQISDTVGFFNQSILNSNELHPAANDSLGGFYDFAVYSPGGWYSKPIIIKDFTVASIFTGHKLHTRVIRPEIRPGSTADYTISAMLLCLLIYTWIQRFYAKRLRQVFKAAALPRFLNQLERDGNLFAERISLGLSVIFILVFTLALGQIAENKFGVAFSSEDGALLYLMLWSAVCLIWLVKSSFIKLIGIIFKTEIYAQSYLLNNLIFNMVTGIILFFPVVMTAYVDAEVYTWVSVVIIFILLTTKILRGILIGLANTDFSILYLFVYLCTLEIAPYILLYKVLTRFANH
ncbi:MAG: DUF4271 domain-containing protein [Bacteroidales bacterium]